MVIDQTESVLLTLCIINVSEYTRCMLFAKVPLTYERLSMSLYSEVTEAIGNNVDSTSHKYQTIIH